MANPKFQTFRGQDGQYYFRLVAGNGEIILQSEGYRAQQSCIHGINSVKVNATNRHLFQELVAKNGEPYFVLRAPNGEVIGTSQTYDSKLAMQTGIMSVMTTAPHAPIEN